MKFFFWKYFILKVVIQLNAELSKDDRLPTCLPPIHEILAEIFPPEQGTKMKYYTNFKYW